MSLLDVVQFQFMPNTNTLFSNSSVPLFTLKASKYNKQTNKNKRLQKLAILNINNCTNYCLSSSITISCHNSRKALNISNTFSMY